MDAPLLLENGKEACGYGEAAGPAAMEAGLGRLRLWMRALSSGATAGAGCLLCSAAYLTLSPERQRVVGREAMLASIPVVALFFTWFHIWLAIQMMFRPLNFIGLWQHKGTGVGIGWQGVVPRKATKMAKTAYRCARPYLLGPRDWLSRVDPPTLVAETRLELLKLVRAALASVCAQHFPDVDRQLPPDVRDELALAAVETIQESFAELWQEFTAILCDEDEGIDNDGMIVAVFTQNKELLNHFFLSLGDREFRFIEHCGAGLGFFCGVVQLVAYNHLDASGRAALLPLTGFFLGIFTNWLAIQMCFKPCYPRPVWLCGRHLFDIQGLFLKRQADVAVLYSKMLCDHFFEFSKIVAYLQTRPELWARLRAAYLAHHARVLRRTVGQAVTCFAPFAFGRRRYRSIEEDLQGAVVARLAEAEELHRLASRYIAAASDVLRSNAVQMQGMPPDKFEDLLHPVFKEDEWILILLGGVLGAIVGFAQVHILAE